MARPYTPLGYQTPIPPQNQSLWDEPYGPPSPHNPLYDMAMAKGSQMHANIGNMDPVQLALGIGLPYAAGKFPRAAAAAWGAGIPMIPEWAHGQQAQRAGAKNEPQFKSQKTLRMEAEAAKEGAAAAREQARTEAAEKANQKAILDEQARVAAEARRVAKQQEDDARAAREAAEIAAGIKKAEGAAAAKKATQTIENTPPSFVATYGPAIGTFGGLAIGKTMQGGVPFVGKGGMQGKIRSAKEAEAARANRLVEDVETGVGGVPGQQGRMNQFVSEGGGAPPFPPGGGAPLSPGGPNFSKLYQSRTPGQNLGPSMVGGTIAGIEGVAGHGIHSGAKEERMAAEAEFRRLSNEGGTDAEYTTVTQKLLRAREKEALGDMLMRGGLYTGVGVGAGEVTSRLPGAMPRPDVGRAEGAYRTMTAPPPLSPGIQPGGGFAPPVGNVPIGAAPPPPQVRKFFPGGSGGGGTWRWVQQ